MLKPIPQSEWYPTERGYFPGALYNEMIKNKDIILITGDLGYGQFDRIRDDLPKQFMTLGAAEQAIMGISVGLALEIKVVFFHTMTSFLLIHLYYWLKPMLLGVFQDK